MDSGESLPAGYSLTNELAEMDVATVHRMLSEESYWAKGIPLAVVEKSLRHSLCFAVITAEGELAAFARVVTDRATYAYLGDVFVMEAHRGRGLSKALLSSVFAHPELQGLRKWSLATGDAHELYARFGFTPPKRPDILMERYDPDVYRKE